jgi:hypothetical protein
MAQRSLIACAIRPGRDLELPAGPRNTKIGVKTRHITPILVFVVHRQSIKGSTTPTAGSLTTFLPVARRQMVRKLPSPEDMRAREWTRPPDSPLRSAMFVVTRRISSSCEVSRFVHQTVDNVCESTPDAEFRGSPVVAYVRSPRIDDPALDVLEAEIRERAVRQGYNLVRIVRDEGVSGIAAWKPGLEQVIHGMERGKYVGVVLPSLRHLGLGRSAVNRIVDRIRRTGGWIELASGEGFLP